MSGFTRPSVYPDWATGSGATRTNPGSTAISNGYADDFIPPAEWHNWQFGYLGDWVRWLDQQQQLNASQFEFDATVGSGSATYPDINTLVAAITGGAVVNKVLVTTLQTLAASQVITSGIADLELVFKPNAFYSQGAGVTPGLVIHGQRIRITGGRWMNFSTSGNIAIQLASDSRNCRVAGVNFYNCVTSIQDNGTGNVLTNNIEEV